MSLEREELLSNCWQVLKSDMYSIAISEHVPILIVAIYNHLMMILSLLKLRVSVFLFCL